MMEEIKFYAKINEDGVCISVSQAAGVIDELNMIEIPNFDDSFYLRRVYKDGVWQDVKMDYDNEKELLAKKVVMLQDENIELKLAIAELAETMMGGAI